MAKDAITLQVGERESKIPLLMFVAGWIRLCKQYALAEPGIVSSWQSQRMALHAPSGAGAARDSFSVEALCKMLSVVYSWTMAVDPNFAARNAGFLQVDSDGMAKLSIDAITDWYDTPLAMRDAMEQAAKEEMHPKQFASLD
jgi:hypothetical protein